MEFASDFYSIYTHIDTFVSISIVYDTYTRLVFLFGCFTDTYNYCKMSLVYIGKEFMNYEY